MSKPIAENCNRLSIFWLRKVGALPTSGGVSSGSISWTFRMKKNSIGYTTVIRPEAEKTYIQLKYIYTNKFSGEKQNLDYKIQLTTTPCYLRGVRYWFRCPIVNCNRRVGVLYLDGIYFGCRHCYNIAYKSQMEGGALRGSSITMSDIDELSKEVKRTHYKGKMTKKYIRLIKMQDRLDQDFINFARHFAKK